MASDTERDKAMSLSFPCPVWLVIRRDGDADTTIAAYLDKESAKLHVSQARRAAEAIQQQHSSIPADAWTAQELAAFREAIFPWDVETTNDYVVNWSPSYTYEEATLFLHPDQYRELNEGAIAVSTSSNKFAALHAAAVDMLKELEFLHSYLGRRERKHYQLMSLTRIEALIKRAKGE
jgi:hypothetical protein